MVCTGHVPIRHPLTLAFEMMGCRWARTLPCFSLFFLRSHESCATRHMTRVGCRRRGETRRCTTPRAAMRRRARRTCCSNALTPGPPLLFPLLSLLALSLSLRLSLLSLLSLSLSLDLPIYLFLSPPRQRSRPQNLTLREFIDYTTSTITD